MADGLKTQRKLWPVAVCFAVTLFVSNAWARPELQISNKTTMKDVLDACGSTEPAMRAESCELVFSRLSSVAYDAAGGPTQDPNHPVCLPNTSNARQTAETFRVKITAWLPDHPEVQSQLFIGDGSLLAVIGAFACKQN